MRPRRGRLLAAGALAALLLAALAATVLMQPERLARLVLGGIGDGLGLDIGFEGGARYRLRGTPLLEVRDVVVRRPGADAALLRAGRVLVSLPWSTVRGRGRPLLLERIELDAPVLDLPALQAWLASRPPGDGSLPALSDGITVRDGRVLAEGWALHGLDLRLPRFAGDQPLAAEASGTLALPPSTRLWFDLALAATRPANGAGVGARGRLRLEGRDWQLPAFATASGPLRVDDGVLRIQPLRFGASAEYRGAGEPLPFVLGVHAPLRLRDGTWTLAPAAVALRGGGVVPQVDARGRAALGPALLLELDGTMPRWPAAWPALPAPLDADDGPTGIALRYAGRSDATSPLALGLARGEARAGASARLPRLLAWMDAAATGSPLPPLRGRASAPRIEVAGAVLEGVEIGFEPGDAP